MKAGAVDFLSKPVKREVLLDVIQRALARYSTERTARDQADRVQTRFASLTQCQSEVFDLIVAGKLNKQIADELDIAERTVKREREQVMAKLDANSEADLGRLAGEVAAARDRQVGHPLPDVHTRRATQPATTETRAPR